MLIQNVNITNILSIQKLELGFEQNGLVLIDGWNHDRNSANGAGKSSIFDAISFCIYGKLPRKITASEILRKGTKEGSVTVEFTTNEGLWSVTRCRPKSIQFILNNKTQDITQEEFEQRIKLNYTQFMTVLYSAQTPVSKFVALNDSDKKQFLLDLMDLSSFKEKKFLIDNKIKDLKKQSINADLLITRFKSAISAYEESINEYSNSERIEQLTAEVNGLNSCVSAFVIVEPDVSKIDTANKALDAKLLNLERIQTNRRRCLSMIQQHQDKIQMLQNTEIILPDVIECPQCNAEFCASDTTTTIESLQADVDVQVANLQGRMADIEVQDDGSELITSIKEKKILLANKQQEMFVTYRDNLKNLNNYKTQTANKQAELRIEKNIETQQSRIIEQINNATVKLKDAVSVKVGLDSELQINETISLLLSPMGASAYIMDSILDLFNKSVADHLIQVWPNTTYELLSFKENKNGDVRSKFSDLLTIDGHSRSVGSLSGGERAALSLVVDFAITDLMSDIFGISLNPSILDEPFYGLDATSRETMINILDRLSKNRAIYVIDHFSESKAMFNKTINIHKRSGISNIVEVS